MSNGADHYQVLQVAPEACAQVIDAAFEVLREMACRDESEDGYRMLVSLNRAHYVLRDPDRRRDFDRARTSQGEG